MAMFGKRKDEEEAVDKLKEKAYQLNYNNALSQQQSYLASPLSSGLGSAGLQFYPQPAITSNPNWYIQYTPLTAWPSLAGGIDEKKLELLKSSEPRKIGKRVPDGIIPITAWRVWGVSNQKLCAIGSQGIWEPKKPMEAICNAGGSHPAPQNDCNCGMWSFKTLDGLVAATKSYQVKVLGQVSLWGRVIETENGFRAQYAYPKELWLLDSSLEDLGYIYGVPIRSI